MAWHSIPPPIYPGGLYILNWIAGQAKGFSSLCFTCQTDKFLHPKAKEMQHYSLKLSCISGSRSEYCVFLGQECITLNPGVIFILAVVLLMFCHRLHIKIWNNLEWGLLHFVTRSIAEMMYDMNPASLKYTLTKQKCNFPTFLTSESWLYYMHSNIWVLWEIHGQFLNGVFDK